MTAKEELVETLAYLLMIAESYSDVIRALTPSADIRQTKLAIDKAHAAIERAKEAECCHDLDDCQQSVKAEARP